MASFSIPGPFTLLVIALMFMLQACGNEPIKDDTEAQYRFHNLELESESSGESRLTVSPGGEVYLSWIEYVNDSTDALMFSRYFAGEDRWIRPREIARGGDWFVNWADFPVLQVLGEGDRLMFATWLKMSGAGTYDYDIMYSFSRDAGQHWSGPKKLHRDLHKGEHGFVSMAATGDSTLVVAWLDSRNMTEGPDGPEGAMSLYGTSVKFGPHYLKFGDEEEIDGRVCDCCQTSMTATNGGAAVAWRDRSREEIRDIYFASFDGFDWSEPVPVHGDQWEIAACPVNGPALASGDSSMAAAWYTGAGDDPRVLFSVKTARADSFSSPARIDLGNPMGRVGLASGESGRYWLSWMENEGGEAKLYVSLLDASGEKVLTKGVAELESNRKSGFPTVAYAGGKLFGSWTEIDGEQSVVRTTYLIQEDHENTGK